VNATQTGNFVERRRVQSEPLGTDAKQQYRAGIGFGRSLCLCHKTRPRLQVALGRDEIQAIQGCGGINWTMATMNELHKSRAGQVAMNPYPVPAIVDAGY
jgi:hypothetical protein